MNQDNRVSIANNSVNIGNHIAGGDIHYTVIQAKVCPICEEKLLNEGMEVCQHCKDENAELMGKRIFSIALFIFIMLSGWLLQPDNIFTRNLQATEKLKVACLIALSIMVICSIIVFAVMTWIKKIFKNENT